MRVLFALVLSVCATGAIAVHELAPEALTEVGRRVGGARTVEPASPLVEDLPVDPEDVEPTGPAKLRPTKSDSHGERRVTPRASGRRPPEK